MAAFGAPAVPLVKTSAASASSATSTTGGIAAPGGTAISADHERSGSSKPPAAGSGVDTTWATLGTDARSIAANDARATGPSTTTVAPTPAISLAIAAAGAAGSIGTTADPRPRTAR